MRLCRSIAWIPLSLCPLLFSPSVFAADWPQWRGPQRNGISSETGWSHQWPSSGPRRLWTARVGQGFSSVAVVNDRVYTMGNTGNQDTVYCLNANTGRVIWQYSYPCSAGDYAGPRATPTVDGKNVYTLSREGLALCLNAETGKLIWQKDLARETGAYAPQWGFAGSPLVEGNQVLYNVGSAGTAVEKNTGRVVWRSGGGPAGYASPIAYNMGNQRVVALFVGNGIVGVNPANGRILWQHPWNTSFDVNAADPVLAGTDVFISSNYNRGCALLRPGRGRASVIWENRNMRNHVNSCVLIRGYLYGNDENTLKCLDLRTGQEQWRLRGIDKGGLIASDGKLIVLTGRGELLIASATPEQYTELARAKVLNGTCWTHPVLSGGRIFCRSHQGELIALDVRGK